VIDAESALQNAEGILRQGGLVAGARDGVVARQHRPEAGEELLVVTRLSLDGARRSLVVPLQALESISVERDGPLLRTTPVVHNHELVSCIHIEGALVAIPICVSAHIVWRAGWREQGEALGACRHSDGGRCQTVAKRYEMTSLITTSHTELLTYLHGGCLGHSSAFQLCVQGAVHLCSIRRQQRIRGHRQRLQAALIETPTEKSHAGLIAQTTLLH
jgi:hypothetical protein